MSLATPTRPQEPITDGFSWQRENLGDVMVRLGYLTPAEHEIVSKAWRNGDTPTARLPLGEILVAAGHISEDQVAEALDRMRVTGRRFGKELVAAGHLSHERGAAREKSEIGTAAAERHAQRLPVAERDIGAFRAPLPRRFDERDGLGYDLLEGILCIPLGGEPAALDPPPDSEHPAFVEDNKNRRCYKSVNCNAIDYIFHTSHWRSDDYVVVQDNDGKHYPSDHLPVMVNLELKK